MNIKSQIENATNASQELSRELLEKFPFVKSVGIGYNHSNGKHHLIIYFEKLSNEIMRQVPYTFMGYDVEFKIIGKVHKL